MPRLPRPSRAACALLLACLAPLPAASAKKPAPVTVTRLAWRGWPDALRLSNGIVEAVVVPSVGRILSFRLAGAPQTDVIFVNKDWQGKTAAGVDPGTWAAFGGDKLWPSPQSDWPKHIGRAWPPDRAFDGDPESAQILSNGVRLSTPASAAFAARASRTLTLRPGQARLYIAQTLIKDADARGARDAFPLGIWSVTQTRGDGAVFLPLPKGGPLSPPGYVGLDAPGTAYPAPHFTVQAATLRITHDPRNPRKIGAASPQGWLASLYGGDVLFSEHQTARPGPAQPDGGLTAEVYTNPSPAYLEMEMLGPLSPLTHGNRITHDIYWQLQRLPRTPRSRADAQALVEAAMAASLPH